MNYESLKRTSSRLIQKNGVPITITRLASSSGYIKKYDPVRMKHYWEEYPLPDPPAESDRRDDPPEGAVQEWNGFAVVTEWPKGLIDGDNIQFGDVKLLISANVELDARDEIDLSGNTYTVYPPIERVKPNGSTLILQTVNARRV
ncbi:hypothetical protein [Marispirochaeta aestuarii]|uniref:hypothetical protein n=1 Tax=Marispirochaeta aestuarii TaxID=1963862 RepID=UPI002ABE5C9D|nr:hypothetical protein [Marispirochaeta aestuarii]